MHNKNTLRHRAALIGVALTAIAGFLATTAKTASAQEEYQLIGIPVGGRSTLVVKKYGNPTQVLVDANAPAKLTLGTSSASGTSGSSNGMPGGGSGGSPDTPNPDNTGPGGGTPGGDNTPGSTTAPAKKYAQVVTWRYHRPDGSAYEFLIQPGGRVIGIRAIGYKGIARTSRGVMLGQNYSQVVAKYGFPDSQISEGSFLMADYSKSHDVTFQFYKQTVIDILVSPMKIEKLSIQTGTGQNGSGSNPNGNPYGGPTPGQ